MKVGLDLIEIGRMRRTLERYPSFRDRVFTEAELREYWETWNRLYVAKLTYNAAFGKRTTRGRLLDEEIVSEQPRWDMRSLGPAQLDRILELGEVNARLIVD